jgi:hypothetical protein
MSFKQLEMCFCWLWYVKAGKRMISFFSPARQHSREEVAREADCGCQLIHAGTCGGDIHRSSPSILAGFVLKARPIFPHQWVNPLGDTTHLLQTRVVL